MIETYIAIELPYDSGGNLYSCIGSPGLKYSWPSRIHFETSTRKLVLSIVYTLLGTYYFANMRLQNYCGFEKETQNSKMYLIERYVCWYTL